MCPFFSMKDQEKQRALFTNSFVAFFGRLFLINHPEIIPVHPLILTSSPHFTHLSDVHQHTAEGEQNSHCFLSLLCCLNQQHFVLYSEWDGRSGAGRLAEQMTDVWLLGRSKLRFHSSLFRGEKETGKEIRHGCGRGCSLPNPCEYICICFACFYFFIFIYDIAFYSKTSESLEVVNSAMHQPIGLRWCCLCI